MHKSIAAYRDRLRSLRGGDSDIALLETDYLLAHCFDQSRGWILANLDSPLSKEAALRLSACESRFVAAYPLAYVLGEQAFMTLDYRVTADTLIPRPDTASLVEWVLAHFSEADSLRVADLGTGCGTIALMLASEKPAWSVTATDVSDKALAVCRGNAKRLDLMVNCALGSWYDALSGRYDLIISNPPYLAEDDPHLPELSHEPSSALVAKQKGLSDLLHLITHAPGYLAALGVLVLEHGASQGEAVRRCFDSSHWESVTTQQDVAGRDRFTVGYRKGKR